MINYSKKLQPIFDTLIAHSIQPIIVGGFVRDSLLGISSKDIDIELYNLESYEQLQKILKKFGSINSVGKSFGVCKLSFNSLELDFSFPRKDNKVAQGHKGFDIKIYTQMDFKTASTRRDFTINAMGFDIKNKILLDPFNGLNDLHNKVLRVVDNKKFAEDPLRILRAMQFCARFNLKVDQNLIEICSIMIQKNTLQQLSIERIFLEFEKLLIQANKPSLGIEFLKNIHAFDYFLELKDSPFYTQKLTALDKVKSDFLHVKLTLLCYDLTKNNLINFLNKLTLDKTLIKKTYLLYKYKDIFLDTIYIENYNIYKVAEYISVKEVLLIHTAINNNKIYKDIQQKAIELNVYEKKLNAIIEGKDLIVLGLKPSPKFSIILKKCYEAQMKGEFNTKEEGIKWLKNI